MPIASPRRALSAPFGLALVLVTAPASWAAKPKVPEGFEARLVAAVPAVQYTCQVATAPDGSLFVAEDPMDQVGPYEGYKGRIVRFREGHEPELYADGFRAVQGMAWHDGSLYVSHMPFLTVLKDTDGDGKVDSRKDLFKDLGPTNNQGLNDHIVSGLQFGVDGLLYISVGDKGVPKATGPDGRTAQIEGGGSLRCKPDGTMLEVYSTGTRNHLEVNLDPADNVFTYDNTDDGLGWWTRVTHHVDGGYYGYPYDYHPHPDRHLPRMAEYGGGSPCGAAFYKEDAWPEKYRNMGFWAEWGKGKVQGIKFAKDGSSFKVAEMIDFAVKDGDLDFRPIDLAVSYDGKTLYVADWGMGGWGKPDEKVGRVWAISYTGKVEARPRGADSDPIAEQLQQLDHPSFNERMRAEEALIAKGLEAEGPAVAALADLKLDPVAGRHLVWVLYGIADKLGDAKLKKPLIDALENRHAEVRAQAARALGIRPYPEALAALIHAAKDADPSVRLQATIALGRSGDSAAVPALLPLLAESDPFVAFSARQALRRLDCWGEVREGLKSKDPKVRAGLMAAMEGQYDALAVGNLLECAMGPDYPAAERVTALGYAAEVARKRQPWDGKWWGTQPASVKAPAKVDSWAATEVIRETIRLALADPEPPLRLAAIRAVVATADRDALAALRERFPAEEDAAVRVELARALGELGDKKALPLLASTLKDAEAPGPLREAALDAVARIGGDDASAALIDLLKTAGLPADRQCRVIAALGKEKASAAVDPLVEKLGSGEESVRAASVAALAQVGKKVETVAPKLRTLLADPKIEVRKAAIAAAATLKDRDAVPALLLAADRPETRFEAGRALADLPDLRALQVYLRGLADKSTDLRAASASAIGSIRDSAAPVLDKLAERHELSPSALPELARIYRGTKPINRWRLVGPFPIDAKPPFPIGQPIDFKAKFAGADDKMVEWKAIRAKAQGKVDLLATYPGGNEERAAFAVAEIVAAEPRKAQMVIGSDDTLTVWVNGKPVFEHTGSRGWDVDQDRFDVDLVAGSNSIVLKCGNHTAQWEFSAAVSEATDYAFLKAAPSGAFDPDAYRKHALEAKGDPDKGKALFADLKGLACVKCHAVAGQGGNVGPDLVGIASRYPREELIVSVLYPSAKIFSGYEPVTVSLADGRVLTGILKADTAEGLEIQDADAKRIKIPKDDIEARKLSDVSLMPNGLAEGLSKGDFADLIAYLETLKEKPADAPKP